MCQEGNLVIFRQNSPEKRIYKKIKKILKKCEKIVDI